MITTACVFVMCVTAASAATYYVSPSGDERNPGTSEDRPLRVVQHAVDRMRTGDTLVVLDGLYTGSLNLKSGITIRAKNSRKAVFSGVEPFEARFERHAGNIYKARISGNPKQLFYNEQPMTWARWPNATWPENWIAEKKWAKATDGTGPGVLTSDAFKQIEDMDLAGGYCFIRYGKGNSCYSRLIESFDGTTLHWNDDKFYSSKYTGEDGRKGSAEALRKMRKSVPIHPNKSLFFLTGVLELLDAPGEWFVKDDTLYLYPPDGKDPNEAVIRVKTADYCINEEKSVSNITIEGIDFLGCSVRLAASGNSDIRFENAHFTYAGAELLYVDRVQGTGSADKPIYIAGSRIHIEKCLFAGAQNTALKLCGSELSVRNCVFLENNRHANFESRALLVENNGKYRITRNTFFNNCSDAIRILPDRSRNLPLNPEISWNLIFNGGIFNSDCSGIYLPSKSQSYTEVHHNWIHNTNGSAFRLDLAGKELNLHHNVFWASKRGMSVEGYGEFNIYNNTDVHNHEPSDIIRNVLHHSGTTDGSLDKSFPPIDDWNVLNNLVEHFNDRIGPREKITHNEQKKKGLLHPERDKNWLIPIVDRGAIQGNLTGERRGVFTNGELSGLNLIPTDRIVKGGVAQTKKLAAEGVTQLDSFRGAYDVGSNYWVPGSDWMPYGLPVLKTMAEAEAFAKRYETISIVPDVCLAELRWGNTTAQKELDVAYEHVGIAVQQKDTHVWGTSPAIGKDGKVHLFVAQWPVPEDKKERFSGYFKTSEIAQYVGDSPEGPFEFVRMVVRDQDGTFNAPHNPTIQFIDDRYALCFIVNSNEDKTTQRIIMYVADDPNGEWRPAKGAGPDGTILRRPDDASIWCHNSVRGVANPSLLKHNGEYRIYFKAAIPDPKKEPGPRNREFGYGVAASKSLEGPYRFHHERLTSEEMELEDVYSFTYDDNVYMLSRDIGASLGGKEGGLLWVSKDGINFPEEKTRRAFESLATYLDEGALDGAAVHRGSEKGQLERPQVLLIDGEPAYLYLATGLSPEEGFGSCSHVFKLNIKQKWVLPKN